MQGGVCTFGQCWEGGESVVCAFHSAAWSRGWLGSNVAIRQGFIDVRVLAFGQLLLLLLSLLLFLLLLSLLLLLLLLFLLLILMLKLLLLKALKC